MKSICRRVLLVCCSCLFLVSCGSSSGKTVGVFEVGKKIGKTAKGTGTIYEMSGGPVEWPEEGTATEEEIMAIEEKMKSTFAALDAAKINTIYLQQVYYHGIDGLGRDNYVYTYKSDSREVISKWVELLQKMDISGEQFKLSSGAGYTTIAIAEGNDITRLAMIQGRRIEKGMKTRCIVNNYDELRPEILEAARMVSEEIEWFD